jgi:hypothetical protein
MRSPTLSLIRRVLPIFYIAVACAFAACDERKPPGVTSQAAQKPTPQRNDRLKSLIDRKLAFAPGTYARGTIPKGEFIFVSERGGYYAEERDGQIIVNSNLSSFGYVYNHAIGDITSHGYLFTQDGLRELGFSSAKSLYESVTRQENYNFSGHYKVGIDIPPGRYTVESTGQAYVEINRGPIGNGEILSNDNFNGTKSISLRAGQYLTLQRATLISQSK